MLPPNPPRSSRHRFPYSVFCVSVGLCLLTAPKAPQSAAQEAPAAPAPKKETPAPTPVPFFKAFTDAPFFRPVVALTVIAPNEESAVLPKGESLERILSLYHKTGRQFNGVLAIGPETLDALKVPLGDPDPFADMPPGQACTLLMDSLTNRQRGKLMSKDGLGASDLTDPAQKSLFRILLPYEHNSDTHASQSVHKIVGSLNSYSLYPDNYEAAQISNDQLADAHLRIGQEMQITVQTKSKNYATFGQYGAPDSNVYTSDEGHYNRDILNGALIRRQIPNTPKPSDLDLDSSVFLAPIPLNGVKTVADLVSQIAKVSHVELYADIRYEKRLLLMRNGQSAAPMRDLLRALAFSVGGTYRKVGPAFVLTNDLAGYGAQCQAIADFEELAEAMRAPYLQKAKKSLTENKATQKTELSLFDDALQLTAEQKENNTKSHEKGDASSHQYDALASISLPFEQLTEAQQKVTNTYSEYAEPFGDPNMKIADLTKDVTLSTHMVTQWVVPGLKGVLRSVLSDPRNGLFELFKKDADSKADKPTALKEKYLAADGAKFWQEQNGKFANRGFLARPKSKEAVDAALRRMKDFGLNQLWLVIFEDGKALIPNTPFPLLPALKDQPDLLAYAIAEAKKENITVCPTLELFAWGHDAPQELRDRNIRGEDGDQIATRADRIRAYREDDPTTAPPPKHAVWVNPLDERVRKPLRDLMRVVGAYAGVGNVVCNSEMSYGYIFLGDNYYYRTNSQSLGYNLAPRLAFLREKHTDPIDVKNLYIRANLNLAQFGDHDRDIDAWLEMLEKLLGESLRQLYAEATAALPEKSRPSLLLMQGNRAENEIWYDQWLNPDSPMPKFLDSLSQFTAPPIEKDKDAAPSKKPISMLQLLLPARIGPLKIERADWPAVLGAQLQDMTARNKAKTWDGFVLEEGDLIFEQP